MRLDKITGLEKSPKLIRATLIITQDDGRTAFGLGEGSSDGVTLLVKFATMFSDRFNPANIAQPRSSPPPPPVAIAGQPMSIHNMDNITLAISDAKFGGGYDTQLSLSRWGQSLPITLSHAQDTSGIYLADGPSIGAWSRQARYAVSFQKT